MKINLVPDPIHSVPGDAAVLVAFEGQSGGPAGKFLEELAASREFTGKLFDTALIHRPEGFAARRLLLVGGGKPEKFSLRLLRQAAGVAVRLLKGKGCREAAMALPESLAGAPAVSAVVEGAMLGQWEPDRHKSEKEDSTALEAFAVAGAGAGAELEAAAARGRAIAEAQNFTRELVNEPSNRLPPLELARQARELASRCGLDCEVLDQDRMRQMGMGALLGVAQGSAEPPALIVLRYRPERAATSDHLGLLGKGVTFDSGGLSIKPADGMEKMKYDMAGGAAVLGAMQALAQLKPPLAVTALIPAVENMTGSRAQRPGDIVTTLSGKTVEVLNTDAEGRLILADALTYARQLGCTHLVDAATLTGAVVVALGHLRVGVFSNHDAFQARVLAAADAEGERMWALPMDDDYKEYLKSAFADVSNVGGRWAGAITAAVFLKEFAQDTPWVHLDIAGTAWQDEAKPYAAKGPTGVGVRTLVRLAADWV